MKANTNKKNKSASRKLVPAVAMLTTSAVMLSSATYAWFTLNKEVEVTGLTMQATTSDSLEISLGDLQNDTKPTLSAPDNADKSWKRSVTIGSYYDTVGKLKPASSADGKNIYVVANDKVYAGGRAVENDANVSVATAAAMPLMDTYNKSHSLAVSDTTGDEGYYIDVPMWIRSANTAKTPATDTPVTCTVTITDPNGTNGSDLINAVRVAIIKTGDATNTDESDAINGLTNTASQITSTSSSVLFGLTDSTYNNYVINGTGTYTDVKTASKPTVNSTAQTVFSIPSANADNYAGVSFIARVWIEGESTYCNDATANQDWNIDFNFSILGGNTSATTTTTTSTGG